MKGRKKERGRKGRRKVGEGYNRPRMTVSDGEVRECPKTWKSTCVHIWGKGV